MKRIEKVALAATAFLLCVNWSMDQDNASVSGGSIKPMVNFKGTVQDNTGKKFEADHITISGLYKQVPVYPKPTNMKDDEYNPTINTVRLDLAEVSKISVPNPNDMHLFNNRKYVEIEVYSKDAPQSKNSYLIENSKKVLCDQVNQAGPIERELAFPAIQEIAITHYEKPQPKDDAPHTSVKKPSGTTSKKRVQSNFSKAMKNKPKKKAAPKRKPAPKLMKKGFTPPKPPMPKRKPL
jgi:hypothetical protein